MIKGKERDPGLIQDRRVYLDFLQEYHGDQEAILLVHSHFDELWSPFASTLEATPTWLLQSVDVWLECVSMQMPFALPKVIHDYLSGWISQSILEQASRSLY